MKMGAKRNCFTDEKHETGVLRRVDSCAAPLDLAVNDIQSRQVKFSNTGKITLTETLECDIIPTVKGE